MEDKLTGGLRGLLKELGIEIDYEASQELSNLLVVGIEILAKYGDINHVEAKI